MAYGGLPLGHPSSKTPFRDVHQWRSAGYCAAGAALRHGGATQETEIDASRPMPDIGWRGAKVGLDRFGLAHGCAWRHAWQARAAGIASLWPAWRPRRDVCGERMAGKSAAARRAAEFAGAR